MLCCDPPELVSTLNTQIADVKPGAEFVKAFSAAVESIKKEVVSIKNFHRAEFEELDCEEKLLSRDIELMVESLNAKADRPSCPAGGAKHGTGKVSLCPTW